jgi:hypothetical protein
MTFDSQGVSVPNLAGGSEASGYWSGTKNPRVGSHLVTPRRSNLHHDDLPRHRTGQPALRRSEHLPSEGT